MKHSETILLTILLLILPLTAALAAAPGVQWRTAGNTLTASTPAYTLTMDKRTGAPQELRLAGWPAVMFGPTGWWRLTEEDGKTLSAADCTAITDRRGNTLQCDYSSPQAQVGLTITFGARNIDLQARVRPTGAVVTRFALPASLVAAPGQINRVYFPIELGRSLERPFFERQPAETVGHWTLEHFDGGESAVGLIPTQMRDYNEPAVPVTVTDAGRDWLGATASTLTPWTVRTPRPPSLPPNAVLLDTPSGPLLSLESVDGGWGRFVRWGGVFGAQDGDRVRRASVQVLTTLWQRPVTAGKLIVPPANVLGQPRSRVMPRVIGIVDMGIEARGNEWAAALAPLGCQIRLLQTPGALRQSLVARDCWLIVNPNGELLPATAADAPQMATAIRAYVANGGVWLLLGGAPFYSVLKPQPYLSVSSDYPPAFSDFLHLDLTTGQISVYGVQSRASVFVPAHLSAAGMDMGGSVSREWITWIKPGQSWQTPLARLAFGLPVQTAIRVYGKDNGLFARTLADKVKPSVLTLLKQSVLLKLNGGTYQEQTDAVRRLPSPTLVHVSDYLHGGFDKQYPDHLPPNPYLGSPGEFRAFVDAVHQTGNLFMPYTNPTWWCDDPPGPTFVREGQAPLLKDRQGKPVRETYGANTGWTLTIFHPAAVAAEKTILDQFTQDYPADVLFQDQVGARSPVYDFNPASPTPDAYTQGLIDLARRDSKRLPLGTENGFDGLLNDETEFCGLVWGLVPTENGPDWRGLWRDQYPANTWRFAPLALWLGHDRALFTMHDLGQFVTNRETLAWVMALGYQISAGANGPALRRDGPSPWLLWLSALQKAVGPEILGAPLTEWREEPRGVFHARYGRATVVANTTAQPYALDARRSLAPFGFSVTVPQSGLMAGCYARYEGRDYGDAGLALIRQGGHQEVYPMPAAQK